MSISRVQILRSGPYVQVYMLRFPFFEQIDAGSSSMRTKEIIDREKVFDAQPRTFVRVNIRSTSAMNGILN